MKNYKRGERKHKRAMKVKRVQRLIWWLRPDYGCEPWWIDFVRRWYGPERAKLEIRRQESRASRYVDNMQSHRDRMDYADWKLRPARKLEREHDKMIRQFVLDSGA